MLCGSTSWPSATWTRSGTSLTACSAMTASGGSGMTRRRQRWQRCAWHGSNGGAEGSTQSPDQALAVHADMLWLSVIALRHLPPYSYLHQRG